MDAVKGVVHRTRNAYGVTTAKAQQPRIGANLTEHMNSRVFCPTHALSRGTNMAIQLCDVQRAHGRHKWTDNDTSHICPGIRREEPVVPPIAVKGADNRNMVVTGLVLLLNQSTEMALAGASLSGAVRTVEIIAPLLSSLRDEHEKEAAEEKFGSIAEFLDYAMREHPEISDE